jgi:hypothetical protein
MKFLSAVVLLALSAAVPASAFMTTPLTAGAVTTTASPSVSFSALNMVATDITVDGEVSGEANKPRKTREVSHIQ